MTEITLKIISETIDGNLSGDSDKIINNVAPFELAGNEDITFAGSPRFLKKLKDAKAGAVIVPRYYSGGFDNLIQVDNPQVAFNKVIKLFYPPPLPEDSICPSACIGADFVSGRDLKVFPSVVIGDNVSIGDRCVLHSGVVVGNNVKIGDDVTVFPNVSVLDGSILGNRVVINAGTVIGSDGFGFAPDGLTYDKIPHRGIVRIDDDVEIGAVNTIDRATMGETWIKSGVKTDNLVHIGHNVVVGENTLLVAQVGIAGSALIGNQVVVAGQTGIAGHIKIGDNTIIGPKSGIVKSNPGNEILTGVPAMPHKTWLKSSQIVSRLPELKKKIFELEKKIEVLEKEKK